MPVEDSFGCVMTPESRRDLDSVAAHAARCGVNVRRGSTVSNAAVVRYALSIAATVAKQGAAIAAQTTPDADRLRAAMVRAGLGPRAAARAAGLGHHSTVSQVLAGRLALDKAGGGALLAWVTLQEA